VDTGPDKIVEDAATVEVFLLSEEPTTAAMQRSLNALTDDDQKQFFVAALAAEIDLWMVSSPDVAGQPNLLLYLDEARDFLPAGTTKPPAKPPLLWLFAQGPKYGGPDGSAPRACGRWTTTSSAIAAPSWLAGWRVLRT
jgi:hypothetical protein